ncbi:574_t:CDS:1, partial [Rhizophagus irregularis]
SHQNVFHAITVVKQIKMWNPSDDENLKILSQSLKVKAFVNQLSKRSVLMKIEEDVGGG